MDKNLYEKIGDVKKFDSAALVHNFTPEQRARYNKILELTLNEEAALYGERLPADVEEHLRVEILERGRILSCPADATPEDILGLDHNATYAEAKVRYRRIVFAIHPDRFGKEHQQYQSLANSLLKRINNAWEQLKKGLDK